MGVSAVRAEAQIARTHGSREADGDRLLTDRKVTRALDQVLQEQIVSALLRLADLDLHAVHLEPQLFADVVIQARR